MTAHDLPKPADVSPASVGDPLGIVTVSGFREVRRTAPGRELGRLLIHESLNHPGKWSVSHKGTGGQMAVARDEAHAEEIAKLAEAEHSDALDLLDLLDWGQQLPTNMRAHPAIKRIKAFRESVEA